MWNVRRRFGFSHRWSGGSMQMLSNNKGICPKNINDCKNQMMEEKRRQEEIRKRGRRKAADRRAERVTEASRAAATWRGTYHNRSSNATTAATAGWGRDIGNGAQSRWRKSNCGCLRLHIVCGSLCSVQGAIVGVFISGLALHASTMPHSIAFHRGRNWCANTPGSWRILAWSCTPIFTNWHAGFARSNQQTRKAINCLLYSKYFNMKNPKKYIKCEKTPKRTIALCCDL